MAVVAIVIAMMDTSVDRMAGKLSMERMDHSPTNIFQLPIALILRLRLSVLNIMLFHVQSTLKKRMNSCSKM
uniref:Candidate secreted effector n=1 Tax=Meloidogyne incognita TaxID=6306 RepID=A0A914M263_MELIC